MICYRDMTFCQTKNCQHFGDDCHRSLTDEVMKKADKWWGKMEGNPPICMFREKPDCFEVKEQEES